MVAETALQYGDREQQKPTMFFTEVNRLLSEL